jgi:hypothetical protein
VFAVLFFSGYFVLSFVILFLVAMLFARIALDISTAVSKRKLPTPLSAPEIWETKAYRWILWTCFLLALFVSAYEGFFQPLPEHGLIRVELIILGMIGIVGAVLSAWLWFHGRIQASPADGHV